MNIGTPSAFDVQHAEEKQKQRSKEYRGGKNNGLVKLHMRARTSAIGRRRRNSFIRHLFDYEMAVLSSVHLIESPLVLSSNSFLTLNYLFTFSHWLTG